MATITTCDRCKLPISVSSNLYDLSNTCRRNKTPYSNINSPIFKYELCEKCSIKVHKLLKKDFQTA